MPEALIVVGHELEAKEKADRMRDYFRAQCRFHVAKAVSAGHDTPDGLADILIYRSISARWRPLLIAYVGHGHAKAWGYGKKNEDVWLELPYRHVAALCAERLGPTLFVSDNCGSGALIAALRREGADPDRVGAIVSSTKDGTCYGDMSDRILAAWRDRKPYVPALWTADPVLKRERVSESRWGATLDHHFFPKPT